MPLSPERWGESRLLGSKSGGETILSPNESRTDETEPRAPLPTESVVCGIANMGPCAKGRRITVPQPAKAKERDRPQGPPRSLYASSLFRFLRL